MADRAPIRVLIADDEDMVRTGFYGALHGGASGFLLKDSGPTLLSTRNRVEIAAWARQTGNAGAPGPRR